MDILATITRLPGADLLRAIMPAVAPLLCGEAKIHVSS